MLRLACKAEAFKKKAVILAHALQKEQVFFKRFEPLFEAFKKKAALFLRRKPTFQCFSHGAGDGGCGGESLNVPLKDSPPPHPHPTQHSSPAAQPAADLKIQGTQAGFPCPPHHDFHARHTTISVPATAECSARHTRV